MIDGPIPGESLTREPKGFNWERPPEFADPEQAIEMHIRRLQDPDRMNTILDALEFEAVDLYTLVKGIMRSAVANGIHSIDIGLIAAPVVHEYIKQVANTIGIEFDEGLDIDKKRKESVEMRAMFMAKKKLKDMGVSTGNFERDDEVEENAAETVMEEAFVPDEETEAPKVRKGLGARKGGM